MARIRTIKPEFWQNQELANCSEFARLLAISLLNHSDDEGYFPASVFLVRAACFPFEDSTERVRGAIDELSSIGFVHVVEASNGKEIGHVVNFLAHQRIDRPKKSTLARPFNDAATETQAIPAPDSDSGTDRRSVVEASSNEQRLEQGTGNREVEQGMEGKGKASGDAATIDPALIDYCDWWNQLHDEGLVKARVQSGSPSDAIQKAWKKIQKDKTVREALERRDDIQTQLSQSSFAKRAGWLTAVKLLGGKNKDGEVIVLKLLEGSYAEDKPAAVVSSGTRFDPNAKDFGHGF
ncbi:MAG: hypothetical protein NXI28_00175 [bacterium]|nr:hypothetical protein [bacterium]